ncbi:MAG: hypothetical protein C4297_10275 [Gemmataceae bacterium]
MYILGLDVGTSAVKAGVIDTDTLECVVGPARRSYSLERDTTDQATLAPAVVWEALGQAAREVTRQCSVRGVGLSCLTPALILLDRAFRPLVPFCTHLDRRSRPVAARIWHEVGEEFLQTTGNRPLPGGISAVVYRWLSEQDPLLARHVAHYWHMNSWLGHRLTGHTGFDPGNATFSGLMDLRRQCWSERWLTYFGVCQEWLPPIYDGRYSLGLLLEESARHLGTEPGVPVKLGLPDTSSAWLAVDLRADEMLHVVGTTQVMAVHAAALRPAPNRLTRWLGTQDRLIWVVHNPVGGAALEWIRQLCFSEIAAEQFYGEVLSEALQRKTDVRLDPPYLGGDRLEIEPRYAGLQGLTLATDRWDLLAALLDAIRRHHLAALEALEVAWDSRHIPADCSERALSPSSSVPRMLRQVYLTGGGADVVRRIIPGYDTPRVRRIEEASLRGTGALFRTGQERTARETTVPS